MKSPMGSSYPPKQVLETFGIQDEVEPLSGASKRAYLAGSIILKYSPESTEEEWVWLSGLLDRTHSDDFRIQKFIKSQESKYLVDGWVAYERLPGDFQNDAIHLRKKREVLEIFHDAIKDEPLPLHMTSERTDPWGLADYMAWGEQPIKCHDRLWKSIEDIVDLIEPLDLPKQLIQGDPQNILFSETEPPAMIDLSWHYRPADFALAVLVVDEFSCWCNGECTCLETDEVYTIFEDITHIDQLLLRAILRRVLELEGLRKFDAKYLDTISGLIPAIEFVSSRVSN